VHPEFCLGFEEYIELHSSLILVSWSGCTQLSKDSEIPAIGIHINYFLLYFYIIVRIVKLYLSIKSTDSKKTNYKFLLITILAHIFMYLFISCLYTFWASQRSSSGDRIVSIHHLVWLVCVSDCLVCWSGVPSCYGCILWPVRRVYRAVYPHTVHGTHDSQVTICSHNNDKSCTASTYLLLTKCVIFS